MNAIEIKEKRLLLGISQKELAKRVGVSTQTINGYENGKEIPSTKYQILDSVLNQNISNIINEPLTIYGVVIEETDEKIIQTLEKLEEVEKIIELATISKDENLINHYTHIAKFLKEQIKLIKKSNAEIHKDLEILKKL